MGNNASMRPTPEGVGNADWRHRWAGPRPASMRPTPEGVGNSATTSAVRRGGRLQ